MSQYPSLVCVLSSGPTLRMPAASGRDFVFEVHPYCGPVRCHSITGDPTKHDFKPDSAFWPLFYRWELGGAKIAHGRCVLPQRSPELDRAVNHAMAFGLVAARKEYPVGAGVSLPTHPTP